MLTTLASKLNSEHRLARLFQGGKVSDIRRRLGIETNSFNSYRKRLIRKGIINGETYGHVYFTLPLFERFVVENY